VLRLVRLHQDLLNRRTPAGGTLRVTLSPGLSAYSFTFG